MPEQSQLFSSAHSSKFVEVILPLALPKCYTYRVPAEWSDLIEVGMRVMVQFGKNKLYAAIIRSIATSPPSSYEAKYIMDIIDAKPIVGPDQLQLWDWIASYYMCSLGDVMQAALPAALKLASETKITLNAAAETVKEALSEKEYLIIEALEVAGELKVNDIVKLLGQKSVFPLIKEMFEKGYISIAEEIKERYKPKMRTFLLLAELYQDAAGRKMLLDSLNRAPKQQDAVLGFLQLHKTTAEISRQTLMEVTGCGNSSISSLLEKGVFVQVEKAISRFDTEELLAANEFVLNAEQDAAYESIQQQLELKDTLLLHGVTASGKTQLYIRLIEKVLAAGKCALYLLPEIALTAQITARLKLHFGNKLGVYHSKFNDNERAEVWHKVLNGEFQVVVGARSSVFLPFQNLGLIVVDEEHENSYKQYDPAPRYHARDTAIYMAYIQKAKVLLGSATPSVESFYNAKAGKYGFVQLLNRYGDVALPEIQLISIPEESRKENMFTYFSGQLLKGIEEAVANKEQIILFQNRRGHTPLLQCNTCGFTVKCVNCDVSMTYHKSSQLMHCHYCGHVEPPVKLCPACGQPHIESKGFGTERIEEELEILMPTLRIGRLDLDAAKGKHGFDRVINAFEAYEYDVLIGTQMVAKGLDFSRVTLIGIINADTIINFPDFRAYERAYALFSQVSGRAGRRLKAGKVILQTYTPKHRVLEQVVAHDYEGMFMTEVTERKNYLYPPFYRLIRLDIKHTDNQVCYQAATQLASTFRSQLGGRVLGPEPPLVGRVRNYFIQTITLKIERNDMSIAKVKEFVRHSILYFQAEKGNSQVRIQVDVDPY
ncbi:primosomal protein N' [Sphingobacteriaceae bacterium WQ 2009]|uniref:Replication restart protein PriA n=1 Tax=Rhinopithecimicrobium faecis TaxID=2820698 RepID=A0A8T4H7K0_9SPHI|nr:primosomal protein N' [Sphingobacteriaceae bacterium WQ 2009]